MDLQYMSSQDVTGSFEACKVSENVVAPRNSTLVRLKVLLDI